MVKRKINFVDTVIVLAVVIVAYGVFSRFGGQVEGSTSKSQEFYYTLQVKKVRQTTVDAVNKSINTKFNMNDKARQDDLGELVGVDVSGAKAEFEKTDGTWGEGVVPDRYDILLTFRIAGSMSEYGYLTPQLSNIGAGTTIVAKSKFAQVQGTILKVWQGDSETSQE
jgi:uncharacterized protein (UPF0333 family)